MTKDIKKMKLYHCPERIYKELSSIGIKENGPLKISDVSQFDQYHYFGTDAVEDAIRSLNINSGTKILDIGSGIGGPARYLAQRTGCSVTAVEIQPGLNAIASSLTQRCALSGLVKHVCADILDFNEKNHDFDVIVGWLSFLHIPNRRALLKKCYAVLNARGKMFIDDFYKRGRFYAEEIKILSEDIYCNYLPDIEEYKKQVIESGFLKVEIIDKTSCWKTFVRERAEGFLKNRAHNINIYDTVTLCGLEDFYKKMSVLFDGNNLGGARIIAGKQF